MRAFFRKWGVSTRVSSAHYPQSKGRAEAAVKTAKRVLRGNTGADGSLNNDKPSLALLQYLNTPLRDIDRSPAQLAMGRQLRDGVPAVTCRLKVDRFWGQTLRERERQMGRHIERVLQERANTRQSSPPPRWQSAGAGSTHQDMEQGRDGRGGQRKQAISHTVGW